jgi:uncharacterized membrane protein YfcA
VADWVLAAAIGLVSGVLSGAFGIGGGIITTPAIRLLLGAPALIAVGTPLPVIVPGALAGAISYYREGYVELRTALILGAVGLPTAVGGALLATRAGGTVVLLGTALLIVWAAVDTLLQATARPSTGVDEGRTVTRGTGALVAIGALTGLYSGFFGLGGGFVLVPLLTRWLRFDVKRAIGTSLATVTLLAIPGTITHSYLGNVDWVIAAGLALGVIPGALLGARITMGARESEVRIAFATLLVALAAVLAFTELRGVL